MAARKSSIVTRGLGQLPDGSIVAHGLGQGIEVGALAANLVCSPTFLADLSVEQQAGGGRKKRKTTPQKERGTIEEQLRELNPLIRVRIGTPKPIVKTVEPVSASQPTEKVVREAREQLQEFLEPLTAVAISPRKKIEGDLPVSAKLERAQEIESDELTVLALMMLED